MECKGDDVIERRPEEKQRCLEAARSAQKAAADARKLTNDSQRLRSSNSQPLLPSVAAAQLPPALSAPALAVAAAAPLQAVITASVVAPPPVVLPSAPPVAPSAAPAPPPIVAPAPSVVVQPVAPTEKPAPQDEKIASSIYIDFSELHLEPRPLGEGSYGVVYKGTFRGLPVAVKVLKINPSKAIQQRLEDEFLKEVKMLAELRHPNIILFMGATTKPHFCFVTEVRKPSCKKRRKKGSEQGRKGKKEGKEEGRKEGRKEGRRGGREARKETRKETRQEANEASKEEPLLFFSPKRKKR